MSLESILFDARSVITVVSFLTFIGIIWWAFGGSRRARFEQDAMLPFADEPIKAGEDVHHG